MKYTVITPQCPAYWIGQNGRLAWTEDKKEAEKRASACHGIVVDAEAFSKNPKEFFKNDH